MKSFEINCRYSWRYRLKFYFIKLFIGDKRYDIAKFTVNTFDKFLILFTNKRCITNNF